MAIGSAIILFVFGAILAFGVDVETPGLDLTTIGYILMGAGAVGGLFGLIRTFSRENARHRAASGHHVETVETVQPTADGGQIRQTEVYRS